MAKLMRIILIIVVSFVASAATTILLMLHYTKPLEAGMAKSDTTAFQQTYFDKEPVEPVERIVGNLIQFQGNDVKNNEPVRSQSDDTRYFDYALLSKDLAAFSEKVSKFNETLSREIQKLRKVASSVEKTSP